MSTLGPISTALEAELRKQVQQNGIVIWLDRDGHDTELVDRLQNLRAEEQLPYAVHGFRGSHLALMLDLAAEQKEATRHLGRGDNRQLVSELRLLEAGLGSVLPEQEAAMEQRLSDKQGALFSLRAPDQAEGRAVVGEQGLQGGLFASSDASQPGSMEERGAPSC
ncbi:MAG: hypothetical protein ACK587_09120 [Cyanobacteriota bacterium]